MIIEINKDIDRYRESVVLGLTARQLIFSAACVVVGGGIVLLLYKKIGLTGSAYVAIPCVAPLALEGFYSFNEMDFFEYMRRKMYFLFANRTLTYRSTEGDEMIREFEKEVRLEEKVRNKRNADKRRSLRKEADAVRIKGIGEKADRKAEKPVVGKLVFSLLLLVLSVVIGIAVFLIKY